MFHRSRPISDFGTWLASVPGGKLAPSSRIAYVREAESFFSYIGAKKRKMTKPYVEAWLGSRQIDASTATRALAAVRKLCEHRGVPDATRGLRRPKRAQSLPSPIEGLPFLLKQMTDNGNQSLMLTCVFLVETGLRISEACGENGCGFALIEGPAIRVHGKGSKDRIVPLSPDAYAALMMLPSLRLPYTNKQLQAATKPYGFNPHRLRHSFASTLYNRCGDIKLVAGVLGHSSTATTDRYAQLSQDRIREAMNGGEWCE